jgi:hypothetical protein
LRLSYRVHRIPLPTSVTIAKRPSCGNGTAMVINLIWGHREAIYFRVMGWTDFRGSRVICPSCSHTTHHTGKSCMAFANSSGRTTHRSPLYPISDQIPRRREMTRCAKSRNAPTAVLSISLRMAGVSSSQSFPATFPVRSEATPLDFLSRETSK